MSKIKTFSLVVEEVGETSFFNNLKSYTLEQYQNKKFKKRKLTHKEWLVEIKRTKENHLIYRKFITNKINNQITKIVNREIERIVNIFTKKDKAYLKLFYKGYLEIEKNELDAYILFYLDIHKNNINKTKVWQAIDRLVMLKKSKSEFQIESVSSISMFSIMKVFYFEIENIQNEIIEASYCIYDNELFNLIIKRNSNLTSFIGFPEKLKEIIQVSYFVNSYSEKNKIKLIEKQAVEFAKFYIKTKDKRINTNTIVYELILNLRKYKREDIIKELISLNEEYKKY